MERSTFELITSKHLEDKNKILLVDGIAGSAKTSRINNLLVRSGMRFLRVTSSNHLKDDANKRFGGNNKTIASGIFKTNDGNFYDEEIVPDCEAIVIDEILQVGIPAFRWIENHLGQYKIIITTDSKQMLVPHFGERALKEFNKLRDSEHCDYINLTKTFRARNEETEGLYYYLYKRVDSDFSIWKKVLNTFPHTQLKNLVFDENAKYITHTNRLEKWIYDSFNLYDRYDLELLKKGSIANKNVKNNTVYPIIPQESVSKHTTGYLQLSSIGTPTRFQGSEIDKGTQAFYLIGNPDKSFISNRELYVVLSRLQDKNNLIIVEGDVEEYEEIKVYFGKPVKERRLLQVEEDFGLEEVTFPEKVKKYKIIPLSKFKEVMEKAKESPEFHYDRNSDFFMYKGEMYTHEHYTLSATNNRYPTIQGCLSKEPQFDLSKFMPEIYKRFEFKEMLVFGKAVREEINAPNIIDTKAKLPEEYKYCLDLNGAYPTACTYIRFPIYAPIFEDNYLNEGFISINNFDDFNDYVASFWIVVNSHVFEKGTVITRELAEFAAYNGIDEEFIYLCSFLFKEGSRFLGDRVLKLYRTSIESKEIIKANMHWGFLEKNFLEGIRKEYWKNYDYYALDKKQGYKFDAIAIKSEICLIMLKLKQIIYGNIYEGRTVTDAIYFNETLENSTLLALEEFLKPYLFRVSSGKSMLFSNVPDLKHQSDLRKKDRHKDKDRKR